MEMKINEIVRRVLSEAGVKSDVKKTILDVQPDYTGNETGKFAVLTAPENYEIKTFSLPEIGEKEILVKVEGCCISPEDTAEYYKQFPKNRSAIAGQQGTGIVVKIGGNDVKDAAGNVIKEGDKIICVSQPLRNPYSYNGANKSDAPDNWFANFRSLNGTQVRILNDLDLESRLLAENVLAVLKVVKRAIQLYKITADTNVVVAGGKTEGLITVAVLKCLGINRIVMVSGDETSRNMAASFGAMATVDFRQKGAMPKIQRELKGCFGGKLGDVVFQFYPTAVVNRLIEKNGCICAMASVMANRQDARYYDESRPVVKHYYSAKEYEECFELLKKASMLKLPLYRLFTHRYMLEEINEAHWSVACENGMLTAVFNR